MQRHNYFYIDAPQSTTASPKFRPLAAYLAALPGHPVALLLLQAAVAPEAAELAARLDGRAVVRLPALDALSAGRAVDAGRLKGELGEPADLALVARVYGHLRLRLAGLRVLVRGVDVRVDGVRVKALQQRGAGVLQGMRHTQGLGEQGRAKLKGTSALIPAHFYSTLSAKQQRLEYCSAAQANRVGVLKH